ncbi:MAG: Hsp20/alpha crystallin family protein [Actinomycetota bacterium]|nr:Hsp20/alpha crystallin family protein [Actinomycetota bacterium]
MSIIRWEPLRELSSLQSEVNRLFNSVSDLPAAASGTAGANLRRWMPAMDLIEKEDSFVLRADLPGMKEEDLSIEFEDNVLTLSGERKSESEESGEGFHRVERAFGSFSRTLTLPKGIDPESISAEFENGVLEVRIPKPEERKPRRISISVGGESQTIEGSESASPAASAGGEASS